MFCAFCDKDIAWAHHQWYILICDWYIIRLWLKSVSCYIYITNLSKGFRRMKFADRDQSPFIVNIQQQESGATITIWMLNLIRNVCTFYAHQAWGHCLFFGKISVGVFRHKWFLKDHTENQSIVELDCDSILHVSRLM